LGLRETINQAGNAVPSTRRINNHPLSNDITLTAGDVSAFALGPTGKMVADANSVPWNAPSGIYEASLGGASILILHFNMGRGSCPAVQFKVAYKNGGISYRSARDGYGFESGWVELMPNTKTVQDIRLSTSEHTALYNAPGYKDQPPYVITGLVNIDSHGDPDYAYRRALQKLINGTWYNVGGL
ncbi:tail fiber protein, partial [Edwardsiella hoshinae]